MINLQYFSFFMAAVSCFSAALLHFACIFWGANGYRFLGAGEEIVRLSTIGHWYPPLIAFVVGVILLLWALYALSGAGIVRPLPYFRVVLSSIAAIFIVRAVSFPLLRDFVPGNSELFWFISSGVCLFIGLLYLFGIVKIYGY